MNDVARFVERIPQPASEGAAIIAMIERAARDPSIEIEKMERLLAMRERITAKEAEREFNEAMSAAQAEMGPVNADSVNPQTRSKYASYLALDRALRPIYTKHGLALSFNTEAGPVEGVIVVVCAVSKGAYTRCYSVPMPADGKGAKGGDVMTKTHAIGSAMTYGQRYLLKMIFNVAVGEWDDDGNAASDPVITEDQVGDLQALIDSVGANKQAFLKYMGVENLSALPAKDYDRAVKALEAKAKQ